MQLKGFLGLRVRSAIGLFVVFSLISFPVSTPAGVEMKCADFLASTIDYQLAQSINDLQGFSGFWHRRRANKAFKEIREEVESEVQHHCKDDSCSEDQMRNIVTTAVREALARRPSILFRYRPHLVLGVALGGWGLLVAGLNASPHVGKSGALLITGTLGFFVMELIKQVAAPVIARPMASIGQWSWGKTSISEEVGDGSPLSRRFRETYTRGNIALDTTGQGGRSFYNNSFQLLEMTLLAAATQCAVNSEYVLKHAPYLIAFKLRHVMESYREVDILDETFFHAGHSTVGPYLTRENYAEFQRRVIEHLEAMAPSLANKPDARERYVRVVRHMFEPVEEAAASMPVLRVVDGGADTGEVVIEPVAGAENAASGRFSIVPVAGSAAPSDEE